MNTSKSPERESTKARLFVIECSFGFLAEDSGSLHENWKTSPTVCTWHVRLSCTALMQAIKMFFDPCGVASKQLEGLLLDTDERRKTGYFPSISERHGTAKFLPQWLNLPLTMDGPFRDASRRHSCDSAFSAEPKSVMAGHEHRRAAATQPERVTR
jgi:hypothetical protein